jgi:hypothetical protein
MGYGRDAGCMMKNDDACMAFHHVALQALAFHHVDLGWTET